MRKGTRNLISSETTKKNRLKRTSEIVWHTYASLEAYMRDQLAKQQAKLDEMKKSVDAKNGKTPAGDNG